MAFMSALNNHEKLVLTLDVAEITKQMGGWEKCYKDLVAKLEDISIEINLKVPPDLYNDKGEIVSRINTYVQTQKEVKITKQKTESSSGM